MELSNPESGRAMASAAIGRRAVIGGAATALTLAALGRAEAAEAAEVEAASLAGPLPPSVDAVVVGGGLSGLVAARQIRDQGHSVLVLEARNRVGGRVLNHRVTHGEVVESGGAFIGPTQNHIAALAEELGVPTFAEYVAGKSVYLSGSKRSTYNGTVPTDLSILLDAALLQERFDLMAASIDVNAPWNHPQAARWDAMTLHDWLMRNTLNHKVIDLLLSWTQPAFGADTGELSLLYVLWYIACSGDEKHKGTWERNSNTKGGAQESRFVGGSQLIPLRLAKRLGSRVALEAPVRRIVQQHGHVEVHSDRGVVRAKRVIVSAPPPLVRQIVFQPGLPARRRELLDRMPMGKLMKADAVYEKPFWRAAGLNGFGISDHGATRAVFDNSPADGSIGVLLAFIGGSTWRTYGPESRSRRKAAVLAGFAEMFGEQALHPIEYVEHNWPYNTWTRGGPVAIMHPGTMTSYGSSIRTPHGRVHWAGTETATYWTGYMDGAVRSGQRAAAEVVAALEA